VPPVQGGRGGLDEPIEAERPDAGGRGDGVLSSPERGALVPSGEAVPVVGVLALLWKVAA
jgi:hypothetical protein